ncbi:DUF2283 domain-containing protein [Micrococcales bacterium 31B]|nr:DUF2283 domain-containing protein [Micrococcales bacterium 31B]
MKLTYDKEADAAYLHIVDDIAEGQSVRQLSVPDNDDAPGQFVLDFDRDGMLLGLEILFASEVLPVKVLRAADF